MTKNVKMAKTDKMTDSDIFFRHAAYPKSMTVREVSYNQRGAELKLTQKISLRSLLPFQSL